jgi:hypothetical protein
MPVSLASAGGASLPPTRLSQKFTGTGKITANIWASGCLAAVQSAGMAIPRQFILARCVALIVENRELTGNLLYIHGRGPTHEWLNFRLLPVMVLGYLQREYRAYTHGATPCQGIPAPLYVGCGHRRYRSVWFTTLMSRNTLDSQDTYRHNSGFPVAVSRSEHPAGFPWSHEGGH